MWAKRGSWSSRTLLAASVSWVEDFAVESGRDVLEEKDNFESEEEEGEVEAEGEEEDEIEDGLDGIARAVFVLEGRSLVLL